MGFASTFLIALGLSADAFAVAVSNGLSAQKTRFAEALRFGVAFGFFQALMPLIGWWTGSNLATVFAKADHWVAFALLAFIGGKMVYEGIWGEPSESGGKPVTSRLLLLLAVATSIDALAVGVSLSLIDVPIFQPALLIGTTTLVLSATGYMIGKRLGALLGRRVEVLGGVILIVIGAQILIDHLMEGVPRAA